MRILSLGVREVICLEYVAVGAGGEVHWNFSHSWYIGGEVYRDAQVLEV